MVLFYTGPKVVTHCFAQLGVVSSTCYYFTVLYSSRGRKQDYRHYRRATQIINHHLACAFGLFRA